MKRQRLIFSTVVALAMAIALLIGCVPGLEQRDCVVMLGDSIFAYSGNITSGLEELSGHRYRQYYQNGAQLAGTSLIARSSIEDQYDRAVQAGPARSIIMDGGGNDYLLGTGSDERITARVQAAWIRILDKAQRDGVENIVVLGYYVTGSVDADAATAAGMAALGAELEAGGAARGINLVYVDPNKDAYFSSRRPSQYTLSDGIHPNRAASQRLAELIWAAMTAHDIEQAGNCDNFTGNPGNSGCN